MPNLSLAVIMALVATLLPGQLESPSSAWRGAYFAFIFNFLKQKSNQCPSDLTLISYTAWGLHQASLP